MKIGIITYHRSLNCGAVLQAFALQTWLMRNFQAQVEIIDCARPSTRHRFSIRTDSVRSFLGSLYYLVLGLGIEDRRRRKYGSFLMRCLKLSPVYHQGSDIDSSRYQVLCAGSDQIWNPLLSRENWVYFLDFAPDRIVKVAYAPSFGLNEFPAAYRTLCSGFLEKFDKLSVREPSGKKIIQDLLGRDVPVLCDPTLLLDAADYDQVAQPTNGKKQPYICVYSMGHADRVTPFVGKLLQETTLPVIWIVGGQSAQWRNPFKRVRQISCVGPADFLQYIRQAKIVVTNSFHGTAFSLIYKRPFITVLNETPSDSRMESLLKLLGLESHLKKSADSFSAESTDIDDYVTVESKIIQMREASISYFTEALAGVR